MSIVIKFEVHIASNLIVHDPDFPSCVHLILYLPINGRSQHEVCASRLYKNWQHIRVLWINDFVIIYEQAFAVTEIAP